MTAPPTQAALGVVLDTTALRTKDALVFGGLRLLCAMASSAGIPIRLPIVAAAEAHRTGAHEVKEVVREIEKARQALQKYGLPPLNFAAPPDETVAEKVENAIWDAAGEADFAFLDIPEVSHAELVKRDLRQLKPFSTTGKGYRDALIWLSALQWAKEAPVAKLYFVSANKGDFADPDGALHGSLRQEADAAGVDVVLVPTIDQLMSEHLSPTLAPVQGLVGAPLSNAYPQVADAIASSVSAQLDAIGNLAELGDDAPDEEIVDRDAVKVREVEWARQLADGSTLLQARATVYAISVYDDPDPRDPVREYSSGELVFHARAVVGQGGVPVSVEILPLDWSASGMGELSQLDQVRVMNLEDEQSAYWREDD